MYISFIGSEIAIRVVYCVASYINESIILTLRHNYQLPHLNVNSKANDRGQDMIFY